MDFDEDTLKLLKQCVLGTTTKEVISEYVFDENQNKMVLTKQKINEKELPPNADIIKLFYQHFLLEEDSLTKLTDEELLKEKERLLQQLKEEENASRKSKNKGKV